MNLIFELKKHDFENFCGIFWIFALKIVIFVKVQNRQFCFFFWNSVQTDTFLYFFSVKLRLQKFFFCILKVCLDFLLLSFFFRFEFLIFLFAFFHPTEFYFLSRAKLKVEQKKFLTKLTTLSRYKLVYPKIPNFLNVFHGKTRMWKSFFVYKCFYLC